MIFSDYLFPFLFFLWQFFFQSLSPFHWIPHRILRSGQKTLHLIAMTQMANALELILQNTVFDSLKKTWKHALSYLKNGRLKISNVELCNKFLKPAQKRQYYSEKHSLNTNYKNIFSESQANNAEWGNYRCSQQEFDPKFQKDKSIFQVFHLFYGTFFELFLNRLLPELCKNSCFITERKDAFIDSASGDTCNNPMQWCI